ncbi:upf0690 protein c1orf52 homolog [Phtheirospermum japonicum]|uniref:Upf0690 protein c1orf52 homolog n=1 Tax=Phtheirospermum japonicum TaxID=374723 RepID=A0A830BZN8_9LAMI|nr:upf0690 protein c1orf52 homolog [Phtheirospermum japonicum]
MKRGLKWSDGEDDDSSSSDDSSTVDKDAEDRNCGSKSQSPKLKASQVDSAKKKKKGIDFEALSRHGYKGGLSVLKVPPPKEPEKEQNWSWSNGKEKQQKKTNEEEEEESFEERMKTRAALADGERLLNAQTPRERKENRTFQQKEKRKRDLGQTSRGKNYVEEEKRLLRDNGVYSGFDS